MNSQFISNALHHIVMMEALEEAIFQEIFKTPIVNLNGDRSLDNYVLSDKWGSYSVSFDLQGVKTWPSAYRNPFVHAIRKWQRNEKKREYDCNSDFHMVCDELEVCRTKGKNAWHSMYDTANLLEAKGMRTIRLMMKSVRIITEKLKMRLEPFQLETIRACICSRAVRLLNQELFKYVPSIMEAIGAIGSIDLETKTEGEIHSLFDSYCKRFVVVVAPRRNGKSKASKLFVAVNAVCEEGSVIVLLAHQINAVLLYKDDILSYLQTLLDSGVVSFKIRNGLHSIKVEFKDERKKSSFIYFVAGGHNVSTASFLSIFM